MTFKRSIAVLLILSLAACKSLNNPGSDTSVRFYSGACFGRCPVFEITVDEKGNAQLKPMLFCERSGVYEMKLEPKQRRELRRLLKPLSELEKDSFDWFIQDLPAIEIDVKRSEVQIRARMNYPEEVASVVRFFSDLRNSEEWVKMASSSQKNQR